MACPGSAGVDDSFTIRSSPDSWSSATMSVNVPPVSTAMLFMCPGGRRRLAAGGRPRLYSQYANPIAQPVPASER